MPRYSEFARQPPNREDCGIRAPFAEAGPFLEHFLQLFWQQMFLFDFQGSTDFICRFRGIGAGSAGIQVGSRVFAMFLKRRSGNIVGLLKCLM